MRELPTEIDDKAMMEEGLRDQMQKVVDIQKGEVWELEIGSYKVTKSLMGGKVVHLRRVKGASR